MPNKPRGAIDLFNEPNQSRMSSLCGYIQRTLLSPIKSKDRQKVKFIIKREPKRFTFDSQDILQSRLNPQSQILSEFALTCFVNNWLLYPPLKSRLLSARSLTKRIKGQC